MRPNQHHIWVIINRARAPKVTAILRATRRRAPMVGAIAASAPQRAISGRWARAKSGKDAFGTGQIARQLARVPASIKLGFAISTPSPSGTPTGWAERPRATRWLGIGCA